MGRYIDSNEPLSDEDRDFLLSRGRGDEVRLNDLKFGEGGAGASPTGPDGDEDDEETEYQTDDGDDGDEYDPADVDRIGKMKVDDLRYELAGMGQPTDGNKADLQNRLIEAVTAAKRA